MEYRASFWLNFAGSLGASLIDFGAIFVVFAHIPALAGWSVGEVALLFGLAGLSFGLTDMVMGHMDGLGGMIRMGELDTLLTRPMGSLFQVLTSDFQLRRLGKLLQAFAVLAFAVIAADVALTAPKVAVMLSTIVSSAVLFGAIWVTFASICFWTADASEITNAFTYGGNYLAGYPIDIFGVWVRRLLAFVIPTAFVAYFPALYLLDRPTTPGLGRVLPFATPIVALLASIVAGCAWRIALRHYRSTGS